MNFIVIIVNVIIIINIIIIFMNIKPIIEVQCLIAALLLLRWYLSDIWDGGQLLIVYINFYFISSVLNTFTNILKFYRNLSVLLMVWYLGLLILIVYCRAGDQNVASVQFIIVWVKHLRFLWFLPNWLQLLFCNRRTL